MRANNKPRNCLFSWFCRFKALKVKRPGLPDFLRLGSGQYPADGLKIFENCYGIFAFLCYIRELSNPEYSG